MRKCSKCKKDKELCEFYKNDLKNEYSGYCKTCNKLYKKDHYQSNKESYKKSILKHRKWLIDLKMNLSCEKCGYNKSPAALDFHHLDSSTKVFEINHVGCSKRSKEEILEEVEKCVVWCSNCHREHHANCY